MAAEHLQWVMNICLWSKKYSNQAHSGRYAFLHLSMKERPPLVHVTLNPKRVPIPITQCLRTSNRALPTVQETLDYKHMSN